MKNKYEITHTESYKFKCKKENGKYPIRIFGNYEPLASFQALPKFSEFKKNGRKWKYLKGYKPIVDRFVLDVDSADLEKAKEVTKAILQELDEYKEYINVYWSGSKGYHIQINTDVLDIIDTTAEKPSESCNLYSYFMNYFHTKYDEVDLSLKDLTTRLIRIHHTKHEKTGNYKILVDVDADIEEILQYSEKNKDMVEPKTVILSEDKAMELLKKFQTPIENKHKSKSNNATAEYEQTDASIFTDVYNDLLKVNKDSKRHNNIIPAIGGGLNGFVDYDEMLNIYSILSTTTDIEVSKNAEQSFIDAFEDDEMPCNLGFIYNQYKDNELDLSNFKKLSYYLNSKLQTKSYKEFNALFESYHNNWFDMLESKLFDYVDNTENIFKGIIHSLAALYGYGSRFIVINGGSEVGKSEYMNTIKKLIPYFNNLGSSSAASIRRQREDKFNRKIVYLGDKGLKGKSQASKEEFEGIYEVFGGLITEKEFRRDLVIGDKLMQFKLISDGVCVFYSEPYTNLRLFGAGDQYTTRSTFITVNPVNDGLELFLQDETKENTFYSMHKNYIEYILKNPTELTISKEVKTKIFQESRNSLRTAKYLLALFKAYCQYVQLGNPLTTDVVEFLEVFKPKIAITEIEYMVYEKLHKNLQIVTKSDLSKDFFEDTGSPKSNRMLLQTKDRKTKSYFTAKQIKTYFKSDFQRNKNLKDTIDQIPDILHNLYTANYIEKLEWQYNGQNVYYILQNEE